MKSPLDIRQVSELRVFRGKIQAGLLKRTNKGCELQLDEGFLATHRYQELSYRIPKQSQPLVHDGVNLPTFFAGLLPEGLRFKALVRQLKTSEDDLFSLLAATGERAVGDVYTVAEGIKPNELETPKLAEVNFFELFDQIIDDGRTPKGEEGIAGVQEKISASMISFPLRTAKKEKSYILKLNPRDKPNLTHNEFHCLQLAKKCGLRVNSAKMVSDKENNPGILVERFDRVMDEAEGQLGIHQEDACQFLDRYPADKYRISFREVCEGIQELATAPLIEISRALQLYIFSYLIGNGDLHAKNISLQTDPGSGRIQLTPAYDLICTRLYKDQTMALKVDGRDRNFKRRYFIDFGTRFGLSQKSIESTIDKLISGVEKNRDHLMEIPLLNKKDKELLRVMIAQRTQALS